jgi:peroxiredoxin
LHQSYAKRGLTVLAVNIGEKKSTVQSFVDENGYTLPILLDSRGTVRSAYGVSAIPITYLVDDQGTVQYVRRGYGSGLEAELRAEIEGLLP